MRDRKDLRVLIQRILLLPLLAAFFGMTIYAVGDVTNANLSFQMIEAGRTREMDSFSVSFERTKLFPDKENTVLRARDDVFYEEQTLHADLDFLGEKGQVPLLMVQIDEPFIISSAPGFTRSGEDTSTSWTFSKASLEGSLAGRVSEGAAFTVSEDGKHAKTILLYKLIGSAEEAYTYRFMMDIGVKNREVDASLAHHSYQDTLSFDVGLISRGVQLQMLVEQAQMGAEEISFISLLSQTKLDHYTIFENVDARVAKEQGIGFSHASYGDVDLLAKSEKSYQAESLNASIAGEMLLLSGNVTKEVDSQIQIEILPGLCFENLPGFVWDELRQTVVFDKSTLSPFLQNIVENGAFIGTISDDKTKMTGKIIYDLAPQITYFELGVIIGLDERFGFGQNGKVLAVKDGIKASLIEGKSTVQTITLPEYFTKELAPLSLVLAENQAQVLKQGAPFSLVWNSHTNRAGYFETFSFEILVPSVFGHVEAEAFHGRDEQKVVLKKHTDLIEKNGQTYGAYTLSFSNVLWDSNFSLVLNLKQDKETVNTSFEVLLASSEGVIKTARHGEKEIVPFQMEEASFRTVQDGSTGMQIMPLRAEKGQISRAKQQDLGTEFYGVLSGVSFKNMGTEPLKEQAFWAQFPNLDEGARVRGVVLPIDEEVTASSIRVLVADPKNIAEPVREILLTGVFSRTSRRLLLDNIAPEVSEEATITDIFFTISEVSAGFEARNARLSAPESVPFLVLGNTVTEMDSFVFSIATTQAKANMDENQKQEAFQESDAIKETVTTTFTEEESVQFDVTASLSHAPLQFGEKQTASFTFKVMENNNEPSSVFAKRGYYIYLRELSDIEILPETVRVRQGNSQSPNKEVEFILQKTVDAQENTVYRLEAAKLVTGSLWRGAPLSMQDQDSFLLEATVEFTYQAKQGVNQKTVSAGELLSVSLMDEKTVITPDENHTSQHVKNPYGIKAVSKDKWMGTAGDESRIHISRRGQFVVEGMVKTAGGGSWGKLDLTVPSGTQLEYKTLFRNTMMASADAVSLLIPIPKQGEGAELSAKGTELSLTEGAYTWSANLERLVEPSHLSDDIGAYEVLYSDTYVLDVTKATWRTADQIAGKLSDVRMVLLKLKTPLLRGEEAYMKLQLSVDTEAQAQKSNEIRSLVAYEVESRAASVLSNRSLVTISGENVLYGSIWGDENQNGRIDKDETLIDGVSVTLLSTDPQNSEKILLETSTGKLEGMPGQYELKGLLQGEGQLKLRFEIDETKPYRFKKTADNMTVSKEETQLEIAVSFTGLGKVQINVAMYPVGIILLDATENGTLPAGDILMEDVGAVLQTAPELEALPGAHFASWAEVLPDGSISDIAFPYTVKAGETCWVARFSGYDVKIAMAPETSGTVWTTEPEHEKATSFLLQEVPHGSTILLEGFLDNADYIFDTVLVSQAGKTLQTAVLDPTSHLMQFSHEDVTAPLEIKVQAVRKTGVILHFSTGVDGFEILPIHVEKNQPFSLLEHFEKTNTLIEREGHKFMGWYTTESFEETSKVEDTVSILDADVTLYAKWIPRDFQVTLHLAPLPNVILTLPYESELKLSEHLMNGAYAPVRDGYGVLNYRDDMGVIHDAENFHVPSHDTILYANWVKVGIATFDTMRGKTEHSDVAFPPVMIQVDEAIDLLQYVVPSLKDARFLGWAERSAPDRLLPNQLKMRQEGYDLIAIYEQLESTEAGYQRDDLVRGGTSSRRLKDDFLEMPVEKSSSEEKREISESNPVLPKEEKRPVAGETSGKSSNSSTQEAMAEPSLPEENARDEDVAEISATETERNTSDFSQNDSLEKKESNTKAILIIGAVFLGAVGLAGVGIKLGISSSKTISPKKELVE